MNPFSKRVRILLESLSGWDIEQIGGRSYALIDRKHRTDAWFSPHVQIRSVIQKLGVDLVIDAGANEGQFAEELRSMYGGEIVSFEPVSSAYEKLAAAASSDPNWHVHKLALGSRESTQTINVSSKTNFSSLLKANDYCAERFGSGALGTNQEVVSVRRLDQLLQEFVPDVDDRTIFIKMDTQGYDTEVFAGLGDKVKHVVALLSEVSLIPIYEGMPHWTESISAYEKAGFGVVGMFPVTRDSGRIIEYDCLMIRV